jgi:peptide/nickel transport system permease protein
MATENTAAEELLVAGLRPQKPWLQRMGKIAKKKPMGTVSAIVLSILLLMAIFANVIGRYDPIAAERVVGAALQEPSMKHWLGTDQSGRDVWARIIHGARISLYVGFIAVIIGVGVGVVVGLVSGYFMGWFDMLIQRLVDVILGFPSLILLMALASVLEPSTQTAMVAISFIIWPGISRTIRAACLTVSQNQYVEAAQAIGASSRRIMLLHVTPQCFAPIIVLASVQIGFAIIIEASLSFLGLGTQPPTPSWGMMLSEGRRFIETAWWLGLFPGLAISLVVLSFNMMGDTLRDVLDPRLRGA